MKRFLAFCLVITLILVSVSSVFAEEEIKVTLNGSELSFDVPPQIISGRTMVPIRAIFEAMGASVQWNETDQSATCTNGSTTVVMKVGSSNFWVNNEERTMDTAPVVINNRTLAPARYVAESFGYGVTWDSDSQTAEIFEKEEKMDYFDEIGRGGFAEKTDIFFGVEDRTSVRIVTMDTEVLNKTFDITPEMFADSGKRRLCTVTIYKKDILPVKVKKTVNNLYGQLIFTYQTATGTFEKKVTVEHLPQVIDPSAGIDMSYFGEFIGGKLPLVDDGVFLYLDRMEIVKNEDTTVGYKRLMIEFEGKLKLGNYFSFCLVFRDADGFEIGDELVIIQTTSSSGGSFKIREEYFVPPETTKIEYRKEW